MSILSRLKEAKQDERRVGTRKITVLEKTEREPAFIVHTYFLPRGEWDAITRPYRKKNEGPIIALGLDWGPRLSSDEEQKIRRRTLRKVVDSWEGFTVGNLFRCSEAAFLNREMFPDATEEIECTPDAIDELATYINTGDFNTILLGARDQESWVTESGPEEGDSDDTKNSEVSSSA